MSLLNRGKEEGWIEVREGISKHEYHRTLHESAIMVSHSTEESYGYCIAEAIHYGCAVALADAASHPEFVSEEYLFDSSPLEDFRWTGDRRVCQNLMNKFENGLQKPLGLDYTAVQKIVFELKKLC